MKDEFAKMAGRLDNMIKDAGLVGRLSESDEKGYPLVFLGRRKASFISGAELVIYYSDNAMKKLGMKLELCGDNAYLNV